MPVSGWKLGNGLVGKQDGEGGAAYAIWILLVIMAEV
jgi:hypothetical protein